MPETGKHGTFFLSAVDRKARKQERPLPSKDERSGYLKGSTMQIEKVRILQEFADRVRSVYPKALVWAFGSHVKGTATAESDLDICVVIPRMGPDDRLAISDLAREVGFAHDIHLSTVVISKKDFEQGPLSASPLIETIQSEGMAA